jgi:hypothetical protein
MGPSRFKISAPWGAQSRLEPKIKMEKPGANRRPEVQEASCSVAQPSHTSHLWRISHIAYISHSTIFLISVIEAHCHSPLASATIAPLHKIQKHKATDTEQLTIGN